MDIAYWIIGSVLVIYLIILTIVQYRNIATTKEEFKKFRKTHNEAYDDMSFEEQQMQFNLQGNLFNLPANLIAQLIYYLLHRKKK